MPALKIKNYLTTTIFAIIFLSGILVIFQIGNNLIKKNAKTEKNAVMQISASTNNPQIGTPITLILSFSAPSAKLFSFDAIVNYDPEVLRIDSIKTKSIFPFYPRRLIEDYKNRFIITGINMDRKNPLSAAGGVLAEITAMPLRTGKTRLEFLFDGGNFSNLIDSNDKNILEKAEGIEIEIK